MTYQQEITVENRGHGHMHDLTKQIGEVVTASGISTGVVHVFNVGSTGVVGTIEFEPGLEEDMPAILDRLVPPSRDYGHGLCRALFQRYGSTHCGKS
ncbi:YjbQ family protein [Adhaeretor mobilis]|uniref:YjbQ family protein n=1 Tax=Adhaeretor mobilis TaxID=1930276 RepID=A0A517MYM9_9BACT|nr:YjbQ family protein [Adhaeretor mobilis]QDS99992.1 hypothetical protein HG15A2_33280 [Adhaeretor mobilis]